MKLIFVILALFFRNYSVQQGLPQTTVDAITQDHSGNIWLGTSDGLCRLSGTQVRVFRHSDRDSASIRSNEITRLYTDAYGKIWVRSYRGVSIYDPATDSFRDFDDNIPGTCNYLDLRRIPECHPCSQMFLCTGDNGLYRLDEKADRWKIFWESPAPVVSVCAGVDCLYLSIKGQGLFRWASDTDYTCIYNCEETLRMVQLSSDGKLWALKRRSALMLDIESGENRVLDTCEGRPIGSIRTFTLDYLGRAWLATHNGIVLISDTGSCERISRSPNRPEGLADNSIHSVFCDKSGAIWMGTFYKGVYMCHPNTEIVHSLPLPLAEDGGRAVVRAIAPDAGGRLLISTANMGLLSVDQTSGECRKSVLGTPQERGYNIINGMTMIPQKRKILLARSHIGLEITDFEGRSLRTFTPATPAYYIEQIPGTAEYLISTDSGLYIYNDADGSYYELPGVGIQKRAFCTATDSTGTMLWAGFKKALLRISLVRDENKRLKAVVTAKYPEAEMVQDVLYDKERGATWFASRRGLFRLEGKSGLWTRYGASDGWPTDYTHAIEKDDSGRIWVSTENGVVCFSPEGESGRNIRLWGVKDGMSDAKFNVYANYKAPDGTIIFGGAGGAYCFCAPVEGSVLPPSSRHNPSEPPAPEIIAIRVNELPAKPSGHLDLTHNESNVDISFDIPDFIHPWQNHLEYRLEGVDKEWHRIYEPPFKVSYAFIPKGTHRLLARSVFHDGTASRSTAALTISMRAVWYESLWFNLTMIALVISAVVFSILHIRKNSEKEINTIRRQTRSEIAAIRAERFANDNIAQKDRDFMVKLMEIVEANISSGSFGVQALADALGMSRSNLNIRLKNISEATPVEIISRTRLNKACSLLRNTNKTISEIAAETGFASATYFATFFRKETGMAPSVWVRKNRKKK